MSESSCIDSHSLMRIIWKDVVSINEIDKQCFNNDRNTLNFAFCQCNPMPAVFSKDIMKFDENSEGFFL